MSISNYLANLVELKNQLVANLRSMGVAADESEKLNTLVPKVLECGTKQNVEFVEGYSGEFNFKNVCVSVTIPNGITVIGDSIFQDFTYLKSVTLPGSVTSIGNSAFYGCTSLASITIPDSVTSIGSGTFSGTALLVNQTGVKYADTWVIGCDTDITSAEIKDGTRGIAGSAFRNCKNLADITIPNSVTSIGNSAFSFCTKLTSITIPNSVTTMGGGVFCNCTSLKNVILPHNIKSLDTYSSYNDYGFFEKCSSLASITIPDSVTSIGSETFSYCESLADIYYTGTSSQWSAITKGYNWNYKMGSNVTGGTTIHYNYVPE